MKATIAKDKALAYQDYSDEFEIYTYTLSKQLGAVITQGNRSIAFFSRTLTEMQHFSMIKIELLAKDSKSSKACCWNKGPRSTQTIKILLKMPMG